MSQVMTETPGTRDIPAAGCSSELDSPASEALSKEALWAQELIDALVMHCGLVGRYRRLVHAARAGGNEKQEAIFLELGASQAQTCRQQRQQLHRALALLGAEQTLMSQLLKANDMCSLELRLWEQMAGSVPHGADDRPGQPLQVRSNWHVQVPDVWLLGWLGCSLFLCYNRFWTAGRPVFSISILD